MGNGWLFDPGPPSAQPGLTEDGHLREPPGRLETLGEELADLVWALHRGRYREALSRLEELEPRLAGDAIGNVIRARALAGLKRVDEAEEQLLRARLHASTSNWQLARPLRDAQIELAEARRALRQRRSDTPQPRRTSQSRRTSSRRVGRPAAKSPEPSAAEVLPAPEVELRFRIDARPWPSAEEEPADAATALADYRLRAEALQVEQLRRYDTLLSLGVAQGVDQYEYQLRTVRRVLRDFHGRALLADEVGLGKTIEACLCIEEYLQRGLARRVLLLVPPGLLQQWRDELRGKFGREPAVVDGARARRDADVWGREPMVLTSLALARGRPHAARIAEAGFDMVVVDEAHRLKNRSTLLWKLVDRIRSRYLLLLSATPVENDLVEIYNVLSLLRPGLFSTQAEFKRRFVARGRRRPRDPGELRALLRQVMIRNTRAVAEARLPPRFATTLRALPGPAEAAFRARLDAAIRERLVAGDLSRRFAADMLRAAGARPPAAARAIGRHLGEELAGQARELEVSAKDDLLADLLRRRRDDKVLVFATHVDTVGHLAEVARAAGRRPVVFHGSLGAEEKARVVESFGAGADVMVATDSGGEGFNLHFARTVVNYDLPWNPMRIEQRIGRVHRIGQAREVFVFNLVAAGTLEEEILRVLDEKIDMFELVVGEVEAILGRLGDDEKEFSDLVLDIYAESEGGEAMRARFDALADRMMDAKQRHTKTVAFENEVFGRDMEA